MFETLKKFVPTQEDVENKAILRPLRPLLHHPELWHLERRGMRVAVAIGVWCSWIPLPIQMVAAVLLAIWTRANVPIAVAITFITNPLTIGPMFYYAFKLGTWLLGMEPEGNNLEFGLSLFLEKTTQIFFPLALGCLICACATSPLGWLTAHVLWRVHAVRRWRQRRKRRLLRKSSD